jgi:hypothetical protein
MKISRILEIIVINGMEQLGVSLWTLMMLRAGLLLQTLPKP